MDRALSEEYKRKRILRIAFSIGLLAIILGWAFYSFRTYVKASLSKGDYRWAEAEIGNVEASLSASGTVSPEFEMRISSPVQARIEAVLLNAGGRLDSGHAMLRLDTREAQQQLQQLLDDRTLQQQQIEKHLLSTERSTIDAKSSLEIKQLRIEQLETELKDEKQLEKVGGSTAEKVNQTQINLMIAKRELAQMEAQIRNQQAQNDAQLKTLRYELAIKDRKLVAQREKLAAAQQLSGPSGIITWIKDEVGGWVQEDEIIARVADLSSFKVEASISDRYLDRLKSGGPVIVRINDTDLRGTIGTINPTLVNGTVQFAIQLDQKNHEFLRPNLAVEVFVITAFKDQVVRVENGPFYHGGKKNVAFVIKEDLALKREITVGESNSDFIEIISGIQAGEKVIISDMQEYEHLEEIRIREE